MTAVRPAKARDPERFNTGLMNVMLVVMLAIWITSFFVYKAGGMDRIALLLAAYIGAFVGIGLGWYIAAPDRRRPVARRLIMLMVGGLLLLLALLTDHGNMQIEGLFFGLLLGGAAPFIILHYALAKFIGPFVFGRVWCGWACWYGMVFDLLPYPYSRYRKPGEWGNLRYVHFGISLVMILLLWFVFDYRDGALGISGLGWFVMGLLLYYVIGIAMALYLKDNRAFCKYLCPIAVPLKFSSRYSALRITGTAQHCGDCEACVEMCPMNIRIRDYLEEGQRVLSTECTLCMTCINVCPHDSLKMSMALDQGGLEYVDYEAPRRPPKPLLPRLRFWRKR